MNDSTVANTMVVMKERRQDASAALIHLVDALTQQVHNLNDKLDAHMKALPEERAAIIEEIIRRAVPDGDLEGHHNFHAAAIRAEEKRAEFWEKMKYELTKWGLFGFLGWAFIAMWQHFLQGPAK